MSVELLDLIDYPLSHNSIISIRGDREEMLAREFIDLRYAYEKPGNKFQVQAAETLDIVYVGD
jgi:hypothetical protein